jgi:hypothetical protein
MLATSAANVVDCARGTNLSIQKNDFAVVLPVKISIPGSVANIQGTTTFNDNNAGTRKLGLSIKLQTYSFTDAANKNYILLRYSLTNNSSSTISNLYSGLFMDWDMIEGSGENDLTAYDNTGNFGYVHHQGSNPDTIIGVGLLSSANYGFYAIMNDGSAGGINLYDGFANAEKWLSLSSGLSNINAGPGDISHVVSGGPYNILAGQTIDVAFAIAADLNLNNLRTAFTNARTKYNSIITSVGNENNTGLVDKFELSQNYPNPFNPSTIINFVVTDEGLVTLKIYDVLGNEVKILLNEEKPRGRYSITFDAKNLSSGIYLYKLTSGKNSIVKKLVLVK